MTKAKTEEPDALRSHWIVEIHTRQAMRLVQGRRAGEQGPAIPGLWRFGSQLTSIWNGAMRDDPWADWWLLRIEEGLAGAREEIQALRQHIDAVLAQSPAVEIEVAASLRPVRLDLMFTNPYGYQGGHLLVDYDHLVRHVLTARHVGLLNQATSQKMLHNGARALRRVYGLPQGYKYTGVTREDVRQGNRRAQRALEAMGEVPAEVLEGARRAELAPEILPREGEVLARRAKVSGVGDDAQDETPLMDLVDGLDAFEGEGAEALKVSVK